MILDGLDLLVISHFYLEAKWIKILQYGVIGESFDYCIQVGEGRARECHYYTKRERYNKQNSQDIRDILILKLKHKE
jgi:hypothetical protein